jgi:hypothetical protein
MTWSHFLTLLFGAYLLYYAFNFIYDARRERRQTLPGTPEEFYFHPELPPEPVIYDEQEEPPALNLINAPLSNDTAKAAPAALPETALSSLRQITDQARNEAVDLSRKISY